MSSRSFNKATGPLTLLALLLSAVSIPLFASGELLGSLEFENDLYFVGSTQGSGKDVELMVTLQTGLSRNMIATLEAVLDPDEGWSIVLPPPIYLQPMEEVRFSIVVTSAPDLDPGTRCKLTLSAVKEDGGVFGSDTCIVEVSPTTDFTISPTEEVLVDRPLEGEIGLSLSNTGNTPLSFSITSSEDVISGASTPLLAAGETTVVVLTYSFPTYLDRLFVLITISPAGHMNMVPVQMVRESDRLHIFFGLEPRLFLYPSVPIREGSVTVLVLGGEVDNIGVEAVDAPNGTVILSDIITQADELDRNTFVLDAKGFEGKRAIAVRAFGFVNGERTVSNRVLVKVQGERAQELAPVTVPAVIGGITGGITILAGSAAYLYSASETFRWRWLLLTLVPLYSLIKEDHVLDHFFRGRLYEYIKGNPGITYTALKDHFEVNNGTLTYHLLKLEREGLLVHRNMGRYKMFYAEGVRIRGCEIVVSPLDVEMLDMIKRSPGITASELFLSVSATRSKRSMSRHLKQLQRKGFVEVRSIAGQRRLYLREGEHRYLNPEIGVMELSDVALRTV